MDIIVRILNPLLMLGMPLALSAYLAKKLRADWGLFGAGMLTFIGSQVLHIPFNAWGLAPVLERFDSQSTGGLIATALLLGLSAGLFEELARYLGFRFWLKDRRSWKDALMAGAGHGGIESIILGILVIYALLQAAALLGADLSTVVPADQVALAEAQLKSYWTAPWYTALLGAVERGATICFHLSASVLVARAFTHHRLSWLWLAIGWHTLVDALAVFGMGTWGVYITEAIIVLVGLLSIGIIFLLRESPAQTAPAEPLAPPRIPTQKETRPVTTDDLDDSRYA